MTNWQLVQINLLGVECLECLGFAAYLDQLRYYLLVMESFFQQALLAIHPSVGSDCYQRWPNQDLYLSFFLFLALRDFRYLLFVISVLL
jgi:hypothetical protein